jgi:TolB protein
VVQNSDNAANRRNRGYQIFVMDADGGNVRLIANTNGSGTAPRWSPDGKKLVFISMLSGKNTDKSS